MKKRYRLINAPRTMLLLTLGVASMATTLVAQDAVPAVQAGVAVPVPGQGFGMALGAKMPSKEELGGAKQFHLMSIYTIEIRRVDAVASLENAQKTKLTIGAKGLAKKKSQAFVKSTMEMLMGHGMPVGGAVPAQQPKNNEPEVKFTEIKSFADIDPNTKAMLVDGLQPDPKPYDDAEWLKLVKAVLKPEQFTKYEQVIAANKVKSDKALIDAGVARLSQDLALNKDQENKLTSLVLEQMAKAKQGPGPASQMMMAMQMEGQELTLELTKIDSSKLQSILNPPQFEELSLKLGILKTMVDQMNADMPGAPVEVKQ